MLGVWAWVTLFVVAALVVAMDVHRLENPIGEKNLPSLPPGQADFSVPYIGSRALIAGIDPYHDSEHPEIIHSDQFHAEAVVNGQPRLIIYAPTQLLLYTPFALHYDEDWQSAGRWWFWISLLSIGVLGAVTWLLARRTGGEPLSPALAIVFFVILTLNFGSELGLERGQSDNFFACLCWCGLVLALCDRWGPGMFLTTVGTVIKGYPIVFAIGLAALALRRETWKRALVGGLVGLAVMVAPVLPYMREGMQGVSARRMLFYTWWLNHSFRNTMLHIFGGGLWLTRVIECAVLAIVVICWVNARRALRAKSDAAATWVVLFATMSLALMIGFSRTSVSYDLVLVMPGMLIIAATQRRLGEQLGFSRRWVHGFGVVLAVGLIALFKFRYEGPPGSFEGFPLSGLGLIIALAAIGAAVVRTLSFKRVASS
ncbi:MAG TPA: glycosyltransferase family 87 protein [Kofleriaceae bacterium]